MEFNSLKESLNAWETMPSKKSYGNTQGKRSRHQRLSERRSSSQPTSTSISQDGGKASDSAYSTTTQHLEVGQAQKPGLLIPPARVFQSVPSAAASTSLPMQQSMAFLPSTPAEQPNLYPRDNVMESTDGDLSSQTFSSDLANSVKGLGSSNEELTSSVGNNLSPDDKNAFHNFCETICSRASIDFTNEEIKDIQTSVNKMLKRAMKRINGRGIFNISRIQPCGSMAEQKSNWKYENNKVYIEFDFLAVLKNSLKRCCKSEVPNAKECPGCIMVTTDTIEHKYITRHYVNITEDYPIMAIDICNLFLYELSLSLISSCECFIVQLGRNSASFHPVQTQIRGIHGCDKCTVDMPTGTLSVNTSRVLQGEDSQNSCSFDFLWTSKTGSLTTYDRFLQKPEMTTSLRIQGDFIPTLECLRQKPGKKECEHECFFVPKKCAGCNRNSYNWRKSSCMSEIHTFLHALTEQHRKCYSILKFIHGLCGEYIRFFYGSYHIKITVLNHNKACSNSTENYQECLFQMLDEYYKCCKTGSLTSSFLPVALPCFSARRNLAYLLIKRSLELCQYNLITEQT